eukprot:GSMAST32.ASY1.ANO1.1724.1 assembled CDS
MESSNSAVDYMSAPVNPGDPKSLLKWKRPSVFGDFPEARSGASITVLGNQAIMFGGCTSEGPTNQMYTLKIGQTSFEWGIPKLRNDDPELSPPMPKPKPRWKHSATLFGNNCIFLFGGNLSGEQRLNDCWIFDSVTQLWSCPKYLHTQKDLPTPRSGHTATPVGEEYIYFFGGFGGSGFARRELSDLYCLDVRNLEKMHWKKILCKGKMPKSRSGHCATPTTQEKNHKIYVMGGWNCGEQFNDLWILDCTSNTWSEVDSNIGIPRWNMSACAVEAIPNWKIFIFGGSCGDLTKSENLLQGMYASDTSVMDTGDFNMFHPATTGEPPQGRSDASVAYDTKGSRLIIFGGWANKWFGDICTLDVGSIVGPPYAVLNIEPSMGPVTGGIKMTIIGVDFANRPPVTVRFATRKHFSDAEGEYIDEETMVCTTPSFEALGAQEVQVRVSLRGDSFTTTYRKFTFFNVTDCDNCVAFENEYRRSGGDIFNIVIEDPHGVTLAYDIRDNDDGDYIVIFQAGVAGKYNIEVEFDGTFRGNAGALRGSPFVVDFIRTHDTDTNRMDGQLVTDDLKKTISKLLTFSQSTLEGLKYEVQRGDIPALTDVKEHVMNVTGKQGELQIGVDTCAATISFLSKFELPWLREIVERLDKVQKLWKEAKTQSTKTAVRIAPLVKDASLTIKVDLAEYEATVAEYLDNHRHHEYWKSTTGFQKAQRLIEDARAEHKEQLQLFKKQLRIATVFEFPELLDHSKEMLNIVKNELKWQLQFWEFEESWKTRLRLMGMALWTELDGQGMQTSTEGMLKEIRSLPNEIKFCDAFEVLEKTIVEFTVACPLIKQLTHPAMRPRHWDNLNKMCPVSQIINIGVHRYIGVIEDVTDRARKEEKIEQALVKMNEVWGDLEFGFKEYIDVESHKLKVCVISEEDFYALESDQMTIQGILASKFAAFFLKKLDQWKKSMEMMVTVIQLIRKTSKLWMFLEPLFQGSEEVQNELPMDAEGAYMTKIVKQYCCSKSVQKKLEQIEKSLMECKLSLGRFMESKRGQFPRFYFMGELDLMHVLANGGQPPKLLTHIPKLFPTLQTLVLKEEEVGPQYRVIQFTSLVDPTVKMTGKPEAYLNEILLKIRSTLSTSLNLSLKRFGKKKRTEWLMDKKKVNSAQIVILVSALMFTTSVEKAFKGLSSGDKNALNSVLRLCHQQLSDMILIVRNKISICDRFRVEAMIVKGAHYRDISHNLVQTNTVSPVSFQWSKQLRYKYSPESGAVVSILDASFNYGFEYVGNGARLVVTNLTNRVYLSMTQSMHSKMGCLSVGPSGSGKTSTTCDIAVAMAKPSFIFNFSPEFDYLSLTEIFKGVAASGTWACFDEFDRLPLNVLSVCSLQYKALLNAMRGDQKTVNIEGSQIRLQSTSAIFLNVNPSYRGRVELPDNLRILLRPITLYKPDSQIIYENLLMSSGFQSAKDLAGKLDIVMQMMKDLLAQERHYAWGLRVASNILMLASSVRRNNENMSENSVVMKSIKSICIPTLKTHDLDIFDRILSDIFPGEEPEESKDLDLENAIANAAMERDLWPEEYLLGRCSDLSDALDSSHTVLLMGGVGCGKTECWKSLARARKLKELNVQVINPKAVTVSELLGSIDNESHEWGEGLLPKALRHLAGIRDEEPKWLIVDGEIDAGWAESLNALMDNSKTLILQSNERIHLKFYMRVIFEVNSLENTSPSTVGRSTIIWISLEEGAQWRSIFASWVQHQNVEQEAKDALANLVSIYVEPTVQYLESSKTLLPFSAVGSANTFLAMFSSMIKPDMLVGDVSAVTNNFDRVKFPARETVFDYWLNPGSNVFELWNRSPQFFSVPFDSVTTDISEVVVPVPETCPISFWGQKMISSNRGFLLIGPSGTGKSAILEDMCKKQDKNETMHIRLNCNYYSSTDNLKSPLEHILVKGGENRYAPPGGHDCVYFLDDLSLPQPDQYGTQSIHELLRQHIEYGYWYDTSKLEKKHIENVVYIGSVNPFAGSKSVGVHAHLRRFNAECQSLSESIVTAAVEVHEAVVQNFRKTPINCHFGWSIRNMSHLFKGMLMSNQKEFGNFEKLIALWLHESDRAYGDMMQTSGDFWQYKSYVLKTAKKSFPQMAFEPFFNQAQTEPLCYFHYAESLDEQVYDSVLTWESLREQLSVAVEKHNKHEPKIDLILFNDAMSHITRITRILLQRQGHVCLIGHGCTGKQSLARIACHMNNMPIHALDSENATGLKERLKEMFVLAGAPDKQQVLLLTEEYLRNDDILLIISDLISTCEIQDLYPQDEKDAIITDVMAKAKTELRVLTIDNEMSWDWFIGKVKKNVKVILCMSPTTPDFSPRAKRFPSLLLCPTIDWFRSWPVSTLQEISQMFLAAPTEEKSIDDQVEEFIPLVYSSSTEMVETYFENTQRHVYIAPLDYIDMLRRLRHGLKTKSAAVETDTERLKIGIDKLRRTKNDVGEIEDNMEFLEEAAEEKKKEAEDLAVKVSEQNQEQEICTNVQKDAHAKREMCEGELKKGEPALVRSQIAAETIDKRDLGVCKTLKDPPKGVDDVFAAIMVLFAGVHITDGVDSSGRIRDQLLHDMKIPAINMKEVRQYIENEYFDVDLISSRNIAAGILVSWVINIVAYYDVYISTAPLREALAKATENLAEANKNLNNRTVELKDMQLVLNQLNKDFESAEEEKDDAVMKLTVGRTKLKLARRLARSLFDEEDIWLQKQKEIKNYGDYLVGDVTLASAFVSFVGPFDTKHRWTLLSQTWLPFLRNSQINISLNTVVNPAYALLSDEYEDKLISETLSNDRSSIENAIIARKSKRWPLLLDPQLQAVHWIKSRTGDEQPSSNILYLRIGMKAFVQILSGALEEGQIVLLEGRGNTNYVVLGGSEFEMHGSFRLYMATRLSNPKFSDSILGACTFVDFTVNQECLEEQLLAVIQLAGLQSLILQKLADAEVDVCQDQEIVDILERAKIAAKSAKQKLSIVESTATQLEEIIEKYRPVAERGANIFMLLSDLHKINPNYVFSLNSFVITFARALDKSSSGNNSGGSRSLDKKKRVAEEQNIVMQDKVTSFVFNDVKRSIYNHDHTTLALLFFCKVMAISRKIHPKKLEHLLHSPSNPNPSEMGQISGWLSTEAWAKVCALNEFSEYRYISSHMQADSEEWFDWYFSAEPENEVIPGGEPYENLDYFDRILLIQTLRPDRAKHMILACIESNLGPEYVKHTSFSMKKLYEKSRSCNPILFVLVPGQDPTAWVEAMSSQLDFTPSNGKFVVIALGGNNQDFMETEIRRLGKEGGWILLQNLHLVPETFLRLEEILESVTSQAHEDFRVLLSISTNESNTNTTPAKCVQVCNDEPNELPHIMRSAWSVIPPERILEAEKPTEFKALSFALCSLHAILVGRKRYGSVGWSNNYRFNKRDLGTCINIMERYLDKQISIPWEELRYIFAELVYGGHMSNFWDLRITRNYLDKMFVAELFEQCDILPDFPSLDNASAEYEDYLEHITDNLPSVTNSSSFGIHENSGRNLLVDELGYICKNGMHIFGKKISKSLQLLKDREKYVKEKIDVLIAKMPREFNMNDVNIAAEPVLMDDVNAPYARFAIQECLQMNIFLGKLKKSLDEIALALDNKINMTDELVEIIKTIFSKKVPYQWIQLSWKWKQSLTDWWDNVLARVDQLNVWVSEMERPVSIWLGGLFAPKKYLSAILQSAAKEQNHPIEAFTLETKVTVYSNTENINEHPDMGGSYAHDMYLIGASWEKPTSSDIESIGNSQYGGCLDDSITNTKFFRLPIMLIRPIRINPKWKRIEAGYLRNNDDIFECPVYLSNERVSEFQFIATMNTMDKHSKWIDNGTAILLTIDKAGEKEKD